MDASLHHLKNFTFVVAFYLSEFSYPKIQLKSATEIIKHNLIWLKAMQKLIKHLPSKILYFIYLKLQAFLQSCTEALIYSEVKLSLLDWDEDILELSHGYRKIVSMNTPPHILLEQKKEKPRKNPQELEYRK